jgi:UDP-N-acetylglucosamine transferase subunit ALG13
VGTHNEPFRRLVEAMDDIAGDLDEAVVIQTGNTPYTPRHARSFAFADRREMERLNREARMVVTHGGAGSLIFALRFGKPVVVVPRKKAFGEHINDHQVELARRLGEEGKVIPVEEIGELRDAISRAREMEPRGRETPPMVPRIRRYLEELETQRKI